MMVLLVFVSVPFDKIQHLGISVLISSSISALSNETVGFSAALIAGISKEILDCFGFGTPDFEDILANLLGSAIGVALSRDGEIIFIWEF